MAIRNRMRDAEVLQPSRAELKARSDRLISQALADLRPHPDLPMPSQKAICERVKVLDSTENGGTGVGLHPSTISRSPLVRSPPSRKSSARLAADYLNINLNDLRPTRDLTRVVERLRKENIDSLIQRVVALEEDLINTREQLQIAVAENFEHREKRIVANKKEAGDQKIAVEEVQKKRSSTKS